MKYLLFSSIILLAFIHQCMTPNQSKVAHGPIKPDLFQVYVNDLTESDAWIPMVSKQEIFNLNMENSRRYAQIQLAGICITESSRRQIPYVSKKIDCSLKPLAGNLYRQTAIRQENEKKQNRIKLELAVATNGLMGHIDKVRDLQQTDFNGAMELANQTCRPFDKSNFEVQLILVSDCLHDMPVNDRLQPVSFPPNVTVYVIGKSEKVDLHWLFPDNKVVEIPALKPQFLE